MSSGTFPSNLGPIGSILKIWTQIDLWPWMTLIDGNICYSVNPLDALHFCVTWSTKCINLVFHSLGDDPWFTAIQQSCDASCMDYGNGLLLGSNYNDIQRLQRIQNWSAKLIYCAKKFDHASPYLQELHWLPVRERIIFKIMTVVYKCLTGTAPSYLTACLSLYRPARTNLRSASDITRLTEHNFRRLCNPQLRDLSLIRLLKSGTPYLLTSGRVTLYAVSKSVLKLTYLLIIASFFVCFIQFFADGLYFFVVTFRCKLLCAAILM